MYLTRSSRMIIDYGFLLPVLRVRYVTCANFYLPRLRYTVPHTRISVESQPCAFSGDSRQFEDILRTVEHRNRVACKCLHMQIESTRPSLHSSEMSLDRGVPGREGGARIFAGRKIPSDDRETSLKFCKSVFCVLSAYCLI